MSKKKEINTEVESDKEEVVAKSSAAPKMVSKHGKKYLKAKKTLGDKIKTPGENLLTVADSVDFLKKNTYTKFTETLELHINTLSAGLKGEVVLPHSTGKVVRIAVVDEALIEKLDKNIIDFDILVSTPSMMPKLTKYAKILGPKGLMPNPKSGTVGVNTADIVKKFSGNTARYKTEAKAPIIHMTIGKLDFAPQELVDNINAIIQAVDKKNIKSAFLSATMSPSLQLKI